MGKHYDINKLPPTPENISVFVYVPQRLLLNEVDIMINHGGFNSIKECIRANVPMIVYPLSLAWDQPGGAARVAHHKLGIQGNIRKDRPKTIQRKISFLMRNLDEYQNNIRVLHHIINKANRSENKRILSFIKHM